RRRRALAPRRRSCDGRRLLDEWERDCEGGAVSCIGLQPQLAAVGLDEPFRDRQPEPDPLAAVASPAVKRLEDRGALRRWHSGPAVDDPDCDLSGTHPPADSDRLKRRREAQGVLDQIRKDTLEL